MSHHKVPKVAIDTIQLTHNNTVPERVARGLVELRLGGVQPLDELHEGVLLLHERLYSLCAGGRAIVCDCGGGQKERNGWGANRGRVKRNVPRGSPARSATAARRCRAPPIGSHTRVIGQIRSRDSLSTVHAPAIPDQVRND